MSRVDIKDLRITIQGQRNYLASKVSKVSFLAQTYQVYIIFANFKTLHKLAFASSKQTKIKILTRLNTYKYVKIEKAKAADLPGGKPINLQQSSISMWTILVSLHLSKHKLLKVHYHLFKVNNGH